MNDSGNALIQVPLFCPRLTKNFDVATLSISMLKDDMFSSRRQIHSPQFHRFTVLEMNTSRSVSPRSGKRQHADPVCACQKGMFELCPSQKHLGNKLKFTGTYFCKISLCTSECAHVVV